MDAFVVDVSACIPWCCEDERTNASEEMLRWASDGSLLQVPSLWTWEMLNTIAVIIRHGRISVDRGSQFMQQLSRFNLRIDPAPATSEFPRLHTLATRHGLTAYDASYLDLAQRLLLPLATLDSDLRKAALLDGIEVL